MLNTWQISRSAASIFGKVAGPSEKGRQGCLKVRCSKRCFDIFWNPLRVGPIFKFYKINSLKNYLCIWKVPIIKIVLLVKNLPRFFYMTCFYWNISNSKSVIVFKPCHHSVWWILKFPSNTFVLKLTIWYLRTWNSITGIAIASTYLSPPPLGFSDLPTALIWKDVESPARALSKWLMQNTAHLLNRGHHALHTYVVVDWAYLLHIIYVHVST